MQILAKDGKEFTTVEECLDYEKELEKKDILRRVQELENTGEIVKFIVHKYEEVDVEKVEEVAKEVIIVHTLDNHKLIAHSLAECLYGQQIGLRGRIPVGANTYYRYIIHKPTSKADIKLCEEYLSSGSAVVVELNDVSQVFQPDECKYYKLASQDKDGSIIYKRVIDSVKESDCSSENCSGNCEEHCTSDREDKNPAEYVWRLNGRGVFTKYKKVDKDDIRLTDIPVDKAPNLEGVSYSDVFPVHPLAIQRLLRML